jgi:hypothetical protein
MKLRFKSHILDNLQECSDKKGTLVSDSFSLRERRNIVRSFTNGLATMSEAEAQALGRSEITNHLTTYRNMTIRVARLVSTYTLTNRFVEISTNTGNLEDDFVMSEHLTTAINKGIFHYGTKFLNFIMELAGEIQISGGAPVMFPERDGIIPHIELNAFMPLDSGLDPKEIPYCYIPKEFGISDLKRLKGSVKEGKESSLINTQGVEEAIKYLQERMAARGTETSTRFSSHEFYEMANAIATGAMPEATKVSNKSTLSVWWYYEVKYDKESSYVSATCFTDEFEPKKGKDESGPLLLAYIEKAYKNVDEWLYNVAIDSEIGGKRKLSTLRGIAEIQYPSANEMEELINLILEGDKMRAMPRFQGEEGTDPDKLLYWNPSRDTIVPANLKSFDMRNSTSQLQMPLQILQQNAAQISGGDVANLSERSGELRTQSVERGANSGLIKSNDRNIFLTHLEAIIQVMVWRTLNMDLKPSCEDYEMAMWVRDYLNKREIPYKEISKRKYGRFLNLEVKVNRIIGDGDINSMDETAGWLMENASRFAPSVRPNIVRLATAIKTRNPDLASQLVQPQNVVINTQRIIAENEADTIARRSDLGETLPLNPDDIHMDQIPTHLKDMQALLARSQSRPWDKSDVLTFAGLQAHTQLHLEAALQDPASAEEARSFIQAFTEIVQNGQALATEVENREGSETAQLSPKEQADIALRQQKLDLEGQKVGIDIAKYKSAERQREARQALMSRKQYFNEVMQGNRLKLEGAVTQNNLRKDRIEPTL